MRARFRIGTLSNAPSGRRFERALNDAARAVRSHLDTTKVLRAAVEAAHPLLGSRRTSAWLTTGKEEPRVAHSIGHDSRERLKPPAVVAEAVIRRKAVLNDLTGSLAIPIIAPRAGLLGVIAFDIQEWSAEARDFAERLSYETALALETASMYERAVSEKEKSEAVLARVGDAVVVTDPHGVIREWNQASARIFRRAGVDAVGQTCNAILALRHGEHELDCARGCPLVSNALERDFAVGDEVWRDDGGKRQPLLATAEALRDADGTITEVVHSYRDITKLKEADEAKTLFLATASHELKTPLTVIQGFTQTLLDRDPPPEVRQQALQMIERRAVELNEIVNRLLLSSRIEAGRMQLSFVEVDVLPLVQERVDAMSRSSGRSVALQADENVPRAMADPSAIAIVVDHLLDNAAKYSPGGDPITVTIRDREGIELSVEDRGVGMDDEQMARCFEKFWQAESTDVRRFGGTGIGLYIVRSLVEAMHGSISLTSTLGSGSTFVIRLVPVGARAPAVAVPAKEERRPPADAGVGEQSVIREFMRQIGVPVRRDR